MALHQNVSGTWKALTAWINVSGTWKKAAVWKNVAGTWKQITSLISATLPASMSASDLAYVPFSAQASAFFYNTGSWATFGNISGNGSGTWSDGVNAGSAYEIRWTSTSGTPTSGDTVSVWHSLASSRAWYSSGNNTCSGTVEIRMAASPNTILASTTVTLTAETQDGNPE